MSAVISDLVAKVRAEGVEQTAAAVKQVSASAQEAARALELMAAAAARQSGGTPQGWMDIFTRQGVQPTAAALAQARQEMEKTAVAAQQAVAPTQSMARAATEHATATANGAKAAQAVADGWNASESSIVRFGAGLAGISLGISLVAGAARLVHDAIVNTVSAQVDWERSLVQVRALYGDIAPRVVALSQAQAALPGVTSSQQELLRANMAAGFLTTRYGVSPDVTGSLTTQAARLGGLYALPADQRQALQDAFLSYARTGAGGPQLEAATGQAFDPLTLARRLGLQSEAGLQALTPQQLDQARAQLGIAAAAQANMRGGEEPRALLDAQRAAEQNLQRIQAQVQNTLENVNSSAVPVFGNARVGVSELGQYYERSTGQPIDPQSGAPLTGALGPQTAASTNGAMVSALQDVRDARQALAENAAKNAAALADNQKQLDAANAALSKLGVEAGSAAARLLSFTGSLEDVTSIARGDIGAQAQAAVAARGRSAIPAIGTPSTEIAFQATQTAYQNAYQNYVAQQAQGSQDNAIREWLQGRVQQEGPAGQAQRALDQAQQTQPIYRGMGQAQQQQSQIDLAAAERQAELDKISLDQRDRYVQMLRDTVQLRLQDNSLQQDAIRASADVIRAQQAALPAQRAASGAQYQQNLAQALGQQRMARLIQGQSVADLPGIDQLIQMNVGGQLAAAENAPDLVRANRGIEVAQQGATAISLQDALVQSSIRLQEIQVDTRNLQDIPRQTELNLEVVEIQRASIAVQSETRDYMKQLVDIMTRNGGGGGSVDLGDLIFGGGGGNVALPQSLAGARRGPF